MSAPTATRAQTSRGTPTPPSATFIKRYGIPQTTPIAANNAAPRLLNRHPPSSPGLSDMAKPATGADIPYDREGARAVPQAFLPAAQPRRAWPLIQGRPRKVALAGFDEAASDHRGPGVCRFPRLPPGEPPAL